MSAPVYHNGYEGNVTANGVLWDATEWDGTETSEGIDTTSPKNYDATDGVCYEDEMSGVRGMSGSFKFMYDSTNDPELTIRPGVKCPATFTRTLDGKNVSGTIRVASLAITNSGMRGKFEYTAQYKFVGKFTWA